jgi:dipeptidyl aminopeptidase/acylaminoacyl peptidase
MAWFLPDGRRFLYQIRHPNPDEKGIYLGSLDRSRPRRILGGDFGAQYASGHLLWLNGRTLMAQPFDATSGQLSGTPSAIATSVAASSTGFGAFSVSTNGVLTYSDGLLAPSELRWFDRAGQPLDVLAPAADYIDFRLSPDSTKLALSRTDPQTQAADVWVLDLARNTEARLTAEPLTDAAPLWSPAGDQIIYRSNRAAGNLELFRTAPSPGAPVEQIYSRNQLRSSHQSTVPSNVLSTDWSSDGKHLIYHVATTNMSYDLWALRLDDRKGIPLAQSRSNEIQGVVSPDNRWLAYSSDESGRYEAYVQSFPDPGAAPKITISTGGGAQPRWSRDGRELFYLRADGTLMSVAVRTAPTFSLGASAPLFKTSLPVIINPYRMDYLPSDDGKRFLMKVPAVQTGPPSITVVLNWPALLAR